MSPTTRIRETSKNNWPYLELNDLLAIFKLHSEDNNENFI
jgi:hypothetical protein